MLPAGHRILRVRPISRILCCQRKIILPDAKGMTNPDFRAAGVLIDLKSPSSTRYRTLANNIDVGFEQVDNIILNLTNEISEQEMIRVVNGRFKEHKGLKRIYFRFQGRYWYSKGIDHIEGI